MHSESCVAGVRGALSQVLAEIAETDRGWGFGEGRSLPQTAPAGRELYSALPDYPAAGHHVQVNGKQLLRSGIRPAHAEARRRGDGERSGSGRHLRHDRPGQGSMYLRTAINPLCRTSRGANGD
jgi:hypothetical protein